MNKDKVMKNGENKFLNPQRGLVYGEIVTS